MDKHAYIKESFGLVEIKQTALAAGLQLSDRDLLLLARWQKRICEKNDWIETDPGKLNQILQPVLLSGYLYEGEHIPILKRMIQNYYQLRISFDIYTSDDRICKVLGNEFVHMKGLRLDLLFKRCTDRLIQEGAKTRKERELVIYEQNMYNLFSVMEKAQKQGKISSYVAASLVDESQALFQDHVAYFNHHASTSLHRDDWLRIWDTIDFMFMHGLKEQDLSSLNEYGIRFYFEQGLKNVEEDIRLIEELVKQAEFKKLSIQNEYERNVLVNQIPSYLKSLKAYDGFYKISRILDDLDYPLFEGFLVNKQSDLKGSDLVLYYLKRLLIEHGFCINYNDSLPELALEFEACRGVLLERLNINLFELVLFQRVASIIGNCEHEVLFNKQDVEKIKEKLQSSVNREREIERAITICSDGFTEETREYIQGCKPEILRRFEEFVKGETELLIYHQDFKDYRTLTIHRNSDNPLFFKIISGCEALSDIYEKIYFLKKNPIPIYDLFDLLQVGIFMGEEIELFFSTLSLEEIAILIKVLTLEMGTLNQNEFSLEDFIHDLDGSNEWQKYFLKFLAKREDSWKKEMEDLVGKIRINFA